MTVRRSYLYAAASVGLLLALAGLLLAARGAAGGWTASVPLADLPAALTRVIPWLALFVIGLVVFGVAWGLANRAARPLTLAGAAERGAVSRKAVLYGGQLATLAVTAGLAVLALRGSALHLFAQAGLGPEAVGWPVPQAESAVLAFLLWIYLRYETLHDGDLGREQGLAVGWRRGYTYLVALGGLALSIGGAGEFVRSIIALGIAPLAPDAPWREPMAGAAAAVLVGIPLAATAWRWSTRAAEARPGPEMNALSRVLLRYIGLFIGAVFTLVSLNYLINDIILLILGQPAGEWWGYALAYFPAALVLWLTFSSGIQGDRARGGESPRTARIRRIVRYTITALALAAFWLGLVEVVRLVLQVALARQAGNAGFSDELRVRFALATALVLVGAPAWWGHWWPLHARARLNTPAGHHERASTIRRVYLFAVVLLAAALFVFSIGFGAFLGLNLDAATSVSDVFAALAGAIASAIVALLWGGSHALVLRGDERLLARDAMEAERQRTQKAAPPRAVLPHAAPRPGVPAQAAAPAVLPAARVAASAVAPRRYRREDLPSLPDVAPIAPLPPVEAPLSQAATVPLASHVTTALSATDERARAVAVVDGVDGAAGAALIAVLRRALPDLLIWPVGLNAAAQIAMVNALGDGMPPAVPAAALELATLILGPADIVMPGGMEGEVTDEVLAAVGRSQAAVLLLPPRDVRVHWVGEPEQSLTEWAEQAAREVEQALATR